MAWPARGDSRSGNRSRGQTVIGRWDDTAGGRVQFDVPLFNRNQGGIAESSASIRASRAGLEAAELRTLNDVAAAHAELMPLRSRLDYYEKHVVPLAASTEAMILEVYKIGPSRPCRSPSCSRSSPRCG